MKHIARLALALLTLPLLASCGGGEPSSGGCGQSYQHKDTDGDGKCDECGEDYTDGKDIPDAPVCQHRDADDDALCDECGDNYTDGKDIPDAPVCQHRDIDDDQLCDNCEKAYADGKDRVGRRACKNHAFT